jgi:hypothetical protein
MHARAVVLVAVAVLALAPAAGAAAPRVIMITGAPLDEPVFLSNHGENLELMAAFQRGAEIDEGRVVDPKELRARPYLELWLFWGDTTWEPYVREGRLAELGPEQANQYGRFYPAFGGRNAIMNLDVPGSRKATKGLLEILAAHGIPTRATAPTRTDEAESSNATWPWIVAAALVALTASSTAAAWRRRRRPVA